MRFYKIIALTCFLATSLLSAQNKEISLEEIWNGTFKTQGMDALHSLKNGKQYSVLNFDRTTGTTTIDIYDYNTLEKTKTLVSSADIEELRYFSDYTFSTNENQVLLATNEESIFRRSTLGNYYVFNTQTGVVTEVAAEKIQEPTFSPDGKKVAYARDNNIFVKNLETGTTTQI